MRALSSPPAVEAEPQFRPPRRRGLVSTFLTGAWGVVSGLAPHVLHHIGPLVGSALVSGAGGTALFGVAGLAASVPTLISLRRRFASWWAPTLALAAFAALFTVSAVVVGPQISGTAPSAVPVQETDHVDHHAPAEG